MSFVTAVLAHAAPVPHDHDGNLLGITFAVAFAVGVIGLLRSLRDRAPATTGRE